MMPRRVDIHHGLEGLYYDYQQKKKQGEDEIKILSWYIQRLQNLKKEYVGYLIAREQNRRYMKNNAT